MKNATFLFALLLCACTAPQDDTALDPSYRTWSTYLGDAGVSHYSSLDQIHRGNIQDLEVAWTYHTGDATANSQIQCNPIVVGGVLYATSPRLKLLALDAATGAERWVFDPLTTGTTLSPPPLNPPEGTVSPPLNPPEGTVSPRGDLGGKILSPEAGLNRGVAYWRDGNGDERVFLAAVDQLYAVDAKTGQLVSSFGDGGRVSLKTGLGEAVRNTFVIATTPGVIYRDLYIVGGRVHEGPGPAAPGHIRAFDVRTGELAWVFRTIPESSEFGADTWPSAEGIARYGIGGANAWAGMSVDHERGMVFVPTGSATFDFYGGFRPGDNLFANTLLALDAATGERRWHYQVVRHDIWDRDLPAPPNLVTVEHDGQQIDAVAQITKSGHVWVFERESGEPLFPVEEFDVPKSALDGEATAPRQRLPSKPPPFSRQAFTEDEITDVSPASYEYVRARLQATRSSGQFVPPSTEGTVIFPGFDGGGEWGGAGYDPTTGMLYVNSSEMPWILTMVDLRTPNSLGESIYMRHCALCHRRDLSGVPESNYPALTDLAERRTEEETVAVIRNGSGMMPGSPFLTANEMDALLGFLYGDATRSGVPGWAVDATVPYSHTGYNRFFDLEGYPAVRPPWGLLSAIDLNAGEIAWQVPLGEVPELTARGIPKTGTENYGGPVVTAGGLVFIAASKDEHIRAFDKESGEELWAYKLPFGGYATPATYEVAGRQYLVIAAGGGKMGTSSGDVYMAFALPAP